ncbi:hypothetical protein EMIHUDRAFT_444540, partial [Emiliania huxleyi CCMP1516]|uniref:Uncharacterized protein n=2 Tax=Emiliania huxleyi TaxID=2903 RepID=A0A0D3JCM7_EMIH1
MALFAEKESAAAEIQLELVRLRERELKFLVSHFHSLSTVVSIFIGLANHAFLHGIPPCPTPGEGCSDGIALQSAYQVLTVASLGLFTVALVVALICATMGWRLALCGPPGSMHQAVEALHQFRGQTSLALGAALLATFAAAAIHPLMLLHHSDLAHRPPRVVATASSASCAASAVVTWLGARSAIAHFRLPGEMRTRGYFTFGRRHQLAESRSRGATPGSGTPLRRWLARLTQSVFGAAVVRLTERLSGTVPQPVGRTAPRLIYELQRPLLGKESSGEGGASVGGAKALPAGEPGAGCGDSPGPHAKPAPARVCSVDASAMALRRAAHLVQQGRLGEARTLVREILGVLEARDASGRGAGQACEDCGTAGRAGQTRSLLFLY